MTLENDLKELKNAEALVCELIKTDKYYGVEYDSAQTVRGLTKVPLISKYSFDSGLGYKLFNKAQEEGVIKVGETRNVPTLEIYNQANYPVLIPCGSLFISQKGGQQDRTLVTDVMIGAGEKLNVPVACVEAHRWNPRGYSEMRRMLSDAGVRNLRSDSDFHIMHFASPAMTGGLLGSVSGRVKHYSGRADRFDDVEHLNLFRADQSQVWQNVEKEIEEADVKTPTRTFTEVVVKKEKEGKLEFEVYDSEIGDIFIGGGRVLGMELYETPAMWQNICDQTIKRYKFDFEKDKKFERGLVDKFLSDMAKCGTKAAKSIGLGYDVRLIDGKVEGAGLVVGNANYVPAHFTAMPSLGEGKSDRYPGGGVVRGPYSDISDIFEDMRRRRRGECGPERNPVVGPEWPVVGPEREPVVGGPHDWVYLDSHPPISPGGLIPLRDTRRRRSMRRLDKDLQLLGNIARETSKSD